MKFEDGHGGNMLIPNEEIEFNSVDLENLKHLISRETRYIQILEKQDPFSMELDIEHAYVKILEKIEKLIEKKLN